MIDKATGKPMQVLKSKRGAPYLMIPLEQVEDVKKALDRGQFRYWVDEISVSIEGMLPVTFVSFGKPTDPNVVQAALDRSPDE